MSDEVAAALIGGLVPIVITTFFAWLGNRNYKSKRTGLIETARQRIELITTYVNSQSLAMSDPGELATIKSSAAQELRAIKHALDCQLDNLHKATEKSDNFLLRFFLLYRMRSRKAAWFRNLFFAALVAATFISFIFALVMFSPSSLQEIDEDAHIWATIAVIFISAPGLLLAFLFRWLAKWADRH